MLAGREPWVMWERGAVRFVCVGQNDCCARIKGHTKGVFPILRVSC